MTTITIDRALLEQALESLWQMTKKFNFERLHESRLSDSNVRVSAHDAMNAIRAALAEPEQEETFIPNWANYRQGVADGKAGSPKWHDAPTCDGLWVCNEGDDNPYRWTTHSVKFPISPLLVGEDERWFGPIPQDAKAEGDAIKKGG